MTAMRYSLNSLRHICADHPVIHHKFLKAFCDGAFTKEQVCHFVTQQYFFSISLPSCFAVLYARVPYYLWKVKQPLLDLLNIEAWGSDSEGCHSKYFLEFISFLGIEVRKLTHTDERSYTTEYLAKRFELCANLSRPLPQGISSIALGNEVLNLSIFSAYREGINKIVGLEQCPTGYFDAHVRDEEADFRVFDDVFHAISDEDGVMLREAKKGLCEILDARVVFFDALFKDICREQRV